MEGPGPGPEGQKLRPLIVRRPCPIMSGLNVQLNTKAFSKYHAGSPVTELDEDDKNFFACCPKRIHSGQTQI